MKQFANETKWSNLYCQLDKQAKNNDPIIFVTIPIDVTEDEVNDVIQELRSLYNFKDYSISRNNNKIKGIRHA